MTSTSEHGRQFTPIPATLGAERLDDLGTTEATLPDGLRIELQWATLNGRAEVVAVTILGGIMVAPGADPGGPRELVVASRPFPVTTAQLRTIPLQRLASEHRREIQAGRDPGVVEIVDALPPAVAATIKPWGKPRRGRPLSHYEEVAQVYRDAWLGSVGPTSAVAAHFCVSKSCAATWVARCRDLGLLARTTRGRANGQRKRGPLASRAHVEAT